MDRPTPTDTEATLAEVSRQVLAHRPGLVAVFSGNTALLQTLPVGRQPVTLGRGNLPDERLSRQHAEVRLVDGQWQVRDLGSRNGTFVDGQCISGTAPVPVSRVLRLADTLFLPVRDVAPFDRVEAPWGQGDFVAGPLSKKAFADVRQAATQSASVLITGESGSGKELAARAFHAAGPHREGPFVAVNCATIAEGVAERLLFGARRGAYSGADADAPGYLQASHRGVLFLDEIGELDLVVQAKLLRVLETKEVLPLGAVKPVPLDLSICWATHRNLRDAVAAGRFRADLYYRMSSHHVALPPLRERLEEIPALVTRALSPFKDKVSARSSLVESCMLRPWPGNVRELLGAVHSAAGRALSAGSARVCCHDLDRTAGQPIAAVSSNPMAEAERELPPHAVAVPSASKADLKWAVKAVERRQIEAALAEASGNRELAARRLGISLRSLYYKLRVYDLA